MNNSRYEFKVKLSDKCVKIFLDSAEDRDPPTLVEKILTREPRLCGKEIAIN